MAVLGNTASTLIDNFNDGDISEYTTTTVLDQLPGLVRQTMLSFSAPAPHDGERLSERWQSGPEQALALRAASLGVGQTLVIDTNFNSTPGAFAVVGIAVRRQYGLSR